MSQKETGTLVFTSSPKGTMIVAIDGGIRLMVTKDGCKLKLVIEAPKDTKVRRLVELENELTKASKVDKRDKRKT